MLARHSALFRLAYAKIAAHRLSAGFATSRRNEGSATGTNNRDGQSGMSFNRITSSTNIRDKIIQSSSSEEILKTVGQNSHLLNPTNSAGALRALARFFPNNPRLNRELRADPNFQLLIEKVTSSIDQLEIGAISDFCQAIKRAEQKGNGLGLKSEIFIKIQTRITEILNEKKYDDRSLFYIYFNGADLNIGADSIAKELVRIIREAPQQLSTQQIRNTLMALATKKGPLSGFETALALELDKVLPEYLSGIEPSNKARIFRDLAALEFQYIGPRYRISQSINKIKADLKEGLESFNEEDVLLILDAYHYLPATYPNDLLEIFKDVMSNTVVHNPAAVKSSFLVRYIAHAGQLSRARRINPTALNSIFNLVASRLKTDPLMQREIEDLCQYLLKINLSHQQLKTEIISYLKNLQTDSTNTLFKINGFEYVVRNSTPEANKGFVKELINPEIFPKLNTTALRRIKAIIESLNDPDFGPLLKKIEAEPEYSKLENIRSSLFTGGQRGKHHDEALQVVATLFENLKTTGRNITVQFMTNLLNTIQNRDTQNELIKRPELQNLTTQQIGALLSGLFDLEQSNDSQWSFVLEILKINAERVTSNRVISYLNNNGIKLNAVSLRSPRIVQNWVNFLANLPKIEEERISVIFPLLLRLSDGGIVNYKLIEKFRLNVERCIKEGVPINFSTLGAVTDFLVEHDNCTFEIAQTLFEKSRTQKYVDKSRYRIIAYLYDRKQATPEQKANLQAVAEEEIKKLLTNLGSLDPKHVLEAASAVLMFPYPLIKDHLSNLQAAVKDHIAYVTPNNFAELVKCLALSHRPRAELEHYQPLLRDIAAHFSTFAPKLRTSELIEVLEGFSFCNFKGASVYNVALTLVANIFSKIRIHDLLRILDSFSHVQLKHQDLFEKIGERALEDISRLERDDVETIVRSYLRVGYQGNLKNNSKFWDLVLSKKLLFSQSNQLALYLIIVSDHPSEAQMLKTYFDTVSGAKVASRKVAYTPAAHRVLAYLRTTYPNEPFANQFEALLQEKPADFSKIECAQSELIRSYLRAIGAEFEDNYELDSGIEGIFLKSQNTFVQFWSRQALNYDYSSLRGLSILGHKSNAALAKNKQIKYISLNLHEFLIIPNDLDRVKYLTSKGVQPGKPAEEYDFSLITKKASDKDEPAEAESPEVAKKASKLLSKSETKAPAEAAEAESSSEEEKPSSETSKTSPKKKGADKATTKTS